MCYRSKGHPFLWALGFGVFLLGGVRAGAADPSLVERGKYLFALSGGCGCHTAEGGKLNAGGRPTQTPWGTFYGTNITPDPTHGIGKWTDQEIVDSIRLGVRPSGEVLSPVMPYPAFSGMADEDVRALVAYLRSLPPVARENRPHEVKLPLFRTLMKLWRWLFFSPALAPEKAPASGPERGRYIVEHVAHCGECHTPRTRWGTLDLSLYLAGNAGGVDGEIVPNITPDPETGIGEWSERDIADLLRTGFKPNADNVQGLMALLVEGLPLGYKDMSREDALAVASYLKSVSPIKHAVRR